MTKKVKVVYKRNAPVTLLTLGHIARNPYKAGPNWVGGLPLLPRLTFHPLTA